MSNIYDRWERIMEAVMRREHDRELALAHSRDPSTSSISSSSNFISDFPFHYQNLQLEASTSRLNDAEWKIFLPSDYKKIISRSVTPVTYKTAKDLYLNLCDSPILLDGGKMSFHIDKITGKKCYMIGARELLISWNDTPRKWRWTSHVDSRSFTITFFNF
ncbi:Hypothetical predicted protein [Olea europaea subsp. europaea]|uniref:Uncharacterized protein n=1 Tax=Olea europaea subsp. europaea TaxID=158383 RepID=A0A8S0Q1Z4_OLEEU|nr:Hypothetical predicted protein [Olea europaea subsp. europaea]